jgi:hypothetical protein
MNRQALEGREKELGANQHQQACVGAKKVRYYWLWAPSSLERRPQAR